MNYIATFLIGIHIFRFKNMLLFILVINCQLSLACKSEKSVNEIKGAQYSNAEINKDLVPKDGNLKVCATWSEFIIAVDAAEPGDVIQLKNGTYSGNVSFSRSGTESKPITIIPESRGGVIISGNSSWDIDAKYITIDGFYFARGTSTHPVNFSISSSHSKFINSAIIEWNLGGEDTRLITVKGTHNEIGHCVLRKKNTAGMMIEVVRESSKRNDHRIHHVYFGYFKDPGSGNGFETVRISTSGYSLSSSYTTLESCVFERCDGEAEIISSKSGHNVYRNNTFLNSNGALTLRHGHDGLVEGNFFINTLGIPTDRCNGVRVIGERQIVRNNYFLNLPSNSQAIQVEYGNEVPHKLTQYDQVKNVLIENNTFYNCDKGVKLGASRNPSQTPPKILPPSGIFKNNLIISSKGSGYSLEIEDEIISDNLFSYSNNIISGKDKVKPLKEKLPAGFQYMNALTVIAKDNDLYWPANNSINVGVQKKDVKPFYQSDVVPYWIKLKMDANDPDFVGIPW